MTQGKLLQTLVRDLLVFCSVVTITLPVQSQPLPQTYYVDPVNGTDGGPGSLEKPFATIQYALAVVGGRVDLGIVSDRIYLRGGVYRNTSTETVYRLKLKGTPYNFSVLSAMPCEPNTPGAVQRKSGRWYEKVVIDDSHRITTSWTRMPDRPNLWMTKPGFIQTRWESSYGGDQLSPWRKFTPALGLLNTPSNNPMFTLAPYMLLQDGQPLLWEDSFQGISAPGTRFFDQATGILYVRPINDQDPNTVVFESWYAGPDRGRKALVDGEGRALFDGSMEYTEIRGIEFRMFQRLMENHLVYQNENERVIQRHVLVEDNQFTDGWVHFLLDTHGHLLQGYTKGLAPRFTDRSHWVIRNNIFLRPSRETCQINGENHVFERNDVFDIWGPWCGPAVYSWVTNSRNSRNLLVRYNRILGANNNRWRTGCVFQMELRSAHGDPNNDEYYGGQTFEYNLITNVAQGTIFGMGFGSCRMRNVTIRHNVFASNQCDNVFRISSPLLNLRIENNVFYRQKQVFKVINHSSEKISYDSMPSTIGIHDNIFAECKSVIDAQLLSPAPGSSVVIDRNMYWNTGDTPVGTNMITADPRFQDPARLDFRLMPGSPGILEGPDIGMYNDQEQTSETAWWQRN